MTNKFNAHDDTQNIKSLSQSRAKTTGVMQQWNRAIPESDYIQLGTLRYGIRLSNQNLLNLNAGTEDAHRNSANVATQARVSVNSLDNSTTNGSSNVSTGGNSSNSSSATNKVCCCVGSGALEMPWNNNYARTRLPIPNTSAKNRKSSPSASAASSSSKSTHQQLHFAQKQISAEQASKGRLQYNSEPPKSFSSNNRDHSTRNDSVTIKPNRETSHTLFPTVCCYSNRYASTSNKNTKNNNLVKVSNKYSDSKKLKIVNNKDEQKNQSSNGDNHSHNIQKGTNIDNFPNSKELWPEFSEHGAAKSAQHLGEFATVVRKKGVFNSSEGSVKKSVDGNDLNLNFRNASLLKEAWPKDVNINNLKKENISSEVCFGLNSSVSCTGYNNKRALRKNTSSTSDDVCVDKLSSVTPSASSSPLLRSPQTAVESWSFEDGFEIAVPRAPLSSPVHSVDNDCVPSSPTSRVPSSTDPCTPALSATAYDGLRHIFNESNDHHLSCIDRNNKPAINRTAGNREKSKHITDCKQNVEENLTYENDIPKFEYVALRKSSLPVINHVNGTRSQPGRKLSSDIISTTGNARSDGLSSNVVICHLTPKLGPVDHSNVESRLQSLNRYCAQNLNPCSNSSDLEEFGFIDSSDLSSTGEDIITVISEENYREFQKNHSIPQRNNSVNEVWNGISAPAQIANYYVGCSSDELSSVCSGSESIPAAVINEYVRDSSQSTNEINSTKYDQPHNSDCEENRKEHKLQFPICERNAGSIVQKDSNNNQHVKDGGKELKCAVSNNSNNQIDGGESIVFNNRGSPSLRIDNISTDSRSKSWSCFGRNQLYARISPDKPIMDKRNNTLDRLQKLVKKTTSGNEKSNDRHGTKTERLRELTELLKGSRAPPIPPPRRAKHLQTIERNLQSPHTTASTTSLLNIDAIHSIENRSNLKKTKESRSIDIPFQFSECNRASTPSSPLTDHKVNLRANASTSNLECLQSTSTNDSNVEEAKSVTSFRDEEDIFCKLPKPESRTIVGSYTQKTIPFRSASFSQVDYTSGKYIRSALGAIKNSLLRGKDNSVMENTPLPKENAKDFMRSCSPTQLFSTSESDSVIDDNEVSRIPIKKTELSINLSPPDFDRSDGLDGRELSSNRNSDIETIVEDPEAEHFETIETEVIEQQKAEINVNQASEMVLESLIEEGIPITPQSLPKDEECLQQATTCLIPVPVYDCVVSEWSTARPSEQWIDAAATECSKFIDSITVTEENEADLCEPCASIMDELVVDKLSEKIEPIPAEIVDSEDVNTIKLTSETDIVTPPISIVCTEPDSLVSTTIIETPPTPDEPIIRPDRPTEVVEVRKRHSNNEENGEAVCNCTSEIEEKRRIDKSKRRKGIYIQWPAIDTNIDPESDSNENYTPDDNWRPDKLTIEKDSSLDLSGESFTDLSTKDITSSPEKSKETELFHRVDPNLLDPNTPESDISRPSWPKGSRRQSLTYQSSDEKDDSTPLATIPVRSFRNLFMRSDSVSDNESERASSRDRTSASPAPVGDHDLKRYSKRPLRGPYGQMLEAEMKKPSKVHYNEILEELSKHESSHSFPSFSRGRGSGSQSMDETNDRHSSKLFKPRKASANLPLPAHNRTASSPSKLADLSNIESLPVGGTKRHLGNIEQKSTDSDRSEKSNGKLESKKFSLDSHLSEKNSSHDKHSKRSSSGTSDKHQKRSLDDTRYSHSSRTPSERSYVLNTPDTQKNLVASPELLAELLKGSSEKLVTEQLSGATSPSNGSNALPTAVLKYLDTRTHVVVELFNTEKSYVESLQTIVLKYLNQLKSPENSGLVDTQTVDEIFFMVPAILNIHERFLEELRRRLDAWDPLQKIGDAFVDVFSRPVILDTYTSFVDNWNRAKDAIRVTRQKCPAFARFLETMAREHKGKLSLDNLLIKPVQKFPNYELILRRLLKHTDVDHPDQKLLEEALKLVHDILVVLDCKGKEAEINGLRENELRELEGVIEGISDLVTSERAYLQFDLVSMPSSQATRKERGFFLFNDILVITSIKRRSGTIRKTNTMCPSSVVSTLDTNKYKFLTKISLDDLEIVKPKDENVRRIMKEIGHLSGDSAKLSQMSELAASLRSPHQSLEEAIRDLQREVQRQLAERQTNDAQLNVLELTLNSSNGIQNMTAVFSKPDKRAQWEAKFTEAKQKLASTVERCQIPEFLLSVPIRKTRAGLQFTCASPTLGIQRDVWVCNSDGYVGQVCVLSLVPEPTVTSCNGVCNARILCVASVPAADNNCINHSDAHAIAEESPSIASTINSIVNSSSKPREKRSSKTADESVVSNEKISKNIQLDSDSSSEESEAESQPESTINPAAVTATANLPIIHRHQESNTEDADVQQSTMWLGTEDGCIHVYNCTDNIRIKKNKIKIPHISAVYSILYLNNRVFVSLANGDVCVYSRDHNGWNTTAPFTVSVGTVTSPVTKLLNVHGKLWCAIQGSIKVLNTSTLQVDDQIQISNDAKPVTNMAVLNEYVWISVQNSAHIKCCHHKSFEIIFEVNLAPSVSKMLSNCDDIIRQHKAACLRVTSLLACKDLIWVGTSAGVLLTIAASNVSKGTPVPAVTGIPHGHTGHVRFLTSVETPDSDDFPKVPQDKSLPSNSKLNLNLLVISGGDGYEDFRSTGNNSLSEVAGREDSTNHLLLWQV